MTDTGLLACFAAVAVVFFSGCGAPAPPPAASAPAAVPENAPALPSERVAAPQPNYMPPPESEMPSDPVHRKLVGTAWRIKDMEARFLDAKRIHVRGPQIEPYAPGGITAKYKYDGGSISLDILGKPLSLVWDGKTLTIDGMPAEPVEKRTKP